MFEIKDDYNGCLDWRGEIHDNDITYGQTYSSLSNFNRISSNLLAFDFSLRRGFLKTEENHSFSYNSECVMSRAMLWNIG